MGERVDGGDESGGMRRVVGGWAWREGRRLLEGLGWEGSMGGGGS